MENDTKIILACFGISAVATTAVGFILVSALSRDLKILAEANAYVTEALNIAGAIIDSD